MKYAKAPGGIFRSTAQPDVQWKLQQLQDAGNYCAQALMTVIKVSPLLNNIFFERKCCFFIVVKEVVSAGNNGYFQEHFHSSEERFSHRVKLTKSLKSEFIRPCSQDYRRQSSFVLKQKSVRFHTMG